MENSNSCLIKGTISNKVNKIVTICIVPNHLNTFVQINNNKNAINKLVMFASRIADQLLLYHSLIASCSRDPCFISSITLSYTRILASTPTHILSNIAANPLRDNGYQINLIKANNNVKKKINVTTETIAFFNEYANTI